MLNLMSITSYAYKTKNRESDVVKYDSCKFLKGIPEPSDIVYDKETGNYYIVSDHGILFECKRSGEIIRRAKIEGIDFEGVELKGDYLYVSDEKPRKVYKYRKRDLKIVGIYNVSWQGGRNKAFESITYNYYKKCFVLIAEEPATVIEYDSVFREIGRYTFSKSVSVSGARWYNNEIYILSSSASQIYRCEPQGYSVNEVYNLAIIDPEGIAFDDKGAMVITSDNNQKIYYFKNLHKHTKNQK